MGGAQEEEEDMRINRGKWEAERNAGFFSLEPWNGRERHQEAWSERAALLGHITHHST
jgi:hypothetical protein